MKSAENTVTGAGLIVLNEFHINACFLEIVIIVCFHEISSGITKYSWLDHFQSFNISALCYFYFSHFFFLLFCFDLFVMFLFFYSESRKKGDQDQDHRCHDHKKDLTQGRNALFFAGVLSGCTLLCCFAVIFLC